MRKRANAQFTVNKHTALAVIRHKRAQGSRTWAAKRVELAEPNPGQAGRWSSKQLDLALFGFSSETNSDTPMYVAVPQAKSRLRVKGVENTVYSTGLPRKAFVDMGDGLAVSSPELLFVEMAAELPPFEHLLLGMELLGTYALDAADPDRADPCYGVQPATTIADLTGFIESAKGIVGLTRAKRTLGKLVENAWSPVEALIAALLVMPLREDGYAMGPIALNGRLDSEGATMQAVSHVPDIMFVGSHVGLIYVGEERFMTRDMTRAATDVIADLGDGILARKLDRVIQDARSRVEVDNRRGRDLATSGMTVLPITKEDLLESGGLDFALLQVMDLLEAQLKRDFSLQRRLLSLPYTRRHRQYRIWSLLPGPRRQEAREWLAKQDEPIPLPAATHEAWITFDAEGNVIGIEEIDPETVRM